MHSNYHLRYKKYISKIQKMNQNGGNKKNVFIDNIEKLSVNNNNYREVLYTTNNKNMQLVLMSLKPKEEIGMEVHDNVEQFFRIDKGNGKLIYINKNNKKVTHQIKNGDAIIIPSGTQHNIINDDDKEELKLYTIYTPANHPLDRLQKNKPLDE